MALISARGVISGVWGQGLRIAISLEGITRQMLGSFFVVGSVGLTLTMRRSRQGHVMGGSGGVVCRVCRSLRSFPPLGAGDSLEAGVFSTPPPHTGRYGVA